MKRFKLLKDLPDLKAGDDVIFERVGDITMPTYREYSFSRDGKRWHYPVRVVESCPDFFEEVNTVEKERIEVTLSKNRGLSDNRVKGEYSLRSSIEIPEEKLPEIKKAIESVLNGEFWNEIAVALDRYTEERIKYQFASEGKVNNPEPSSKKEEGWEILEGKSSNGKVHQYLKDNSHGGLSCKEIGCEIFSVLRKSDNNVFTVGDMIFVFKNEKETRKIFGFKASSDRLLVKTADKSDTFYTLNNIAKAPTNTVEDKPLFSMKDIESCYEVAGKLYSPLYCDFYNALKELARSKTSNQ